MDEIGKYNSLFQQIKWLDLFISQNCSVPCEYQFSIGFFQLEYFCNWTWLYFSLIQILMSNILLDFMWWHPVKFYVFTLLKSTLVLNKIFGQLLVTYVKQASSVIIFCILSKKVPCICRPVSEAEFK